MFVHVAVVALRSRFRCKLVAGPNVQRDVIQAFVQTHRNTIWQEAVFQHFGFSTLGKTNLDARDLTVHTRSRTCAHLTR